MRRYDPTDADDVADLARLNAEPWMVEQLALNPRYVHWGPHEDYMGDRDAGWRSPILHDSWAAHEVELDDLNEVVNFYFAVRRAEERCSDCEGSGYNAATKRLSDDWYDFDDTGRRWAHALEQAEVDALWEAKRLYGFTEKPTPDEVNAWSKVGIGHDAINQHVCVRARAERLGVYGLCPSCEGRGSVYTEPAARLSLTYWLIHPRKGASRGVEVAEVRREDLPSVYAFLRRAAERNAERFAKLPMSTADDT